MPWKVFREKGEFCLHKMNPDGSKGDLVHCHKTAEMARRQQSALYVSENKEMSVEDTIIIDEDNNGAEYKELSEYKDFYPDGIMPSYASGAHSFDELDAERAARERVLELSGLMNDYQSLMGNIVYTPFELLDADKIHELDILHEEFKSRAQELIDEPLENDGEEDKEVWTAAYVNGLPDSSFLYVEPGGKKDGEGKTVPRSLRHLPVKDANGKPDAAHIRNAAARANQVKLSGGGTVSPALAKRLVSRAQAMLKRVKKESFFDKAINKVKDIISPEEPSFSVWKEADGSYGWITSYSNKFLDRDDPPDVLASAAHKQFVEKVDKGLAVLPDLYLWHIPEWKIGYATAMAYDEVGFPVAIGRFDDNPECKEVAEWLSKQKDFGVSHGMHNSTIVRDPEDPSIIIAYETYEISPLPQSRAANLLADWNIYEIKELEEVKMAIPETKRQELLKRGLPEATLAALEERNKAKAEAATAEGVKSKETEEVKTETTQPVPETEEVKTETAEKTEEVAKTEPVVPPETEQEKKEEAPTPPANDFPTRQEVAEAVANVVAPMIEKMEKSIEDLQKQMAEINSSDEKRIKEIISMTPRDSLSSLMSARLIDRASSSKQTKVGNGDKLLDTKPREEKDTSKDNGRKVGIPFVDKLREDGK